DCAPLTRPNLIAAYDHSTMRRIEGNERVGARELRIGAVLCTEDWRAPVAAEASNPKSIDTLPGVVRHDACPTCYQLAIARNRVRRHSPVNGAIDLAFGIDDIGATTKSRNHQQVSVGVQDFVLEHHDVTLELRIAKKYFAPIRRYPTDL